MIGELRKGTDLIREAAEGKSSKGRFTPFFSWKDEESKVLYFLTPIGEVPKVLMHNFVRKLVQDQEGKTVERWMTFMCRKDPAWMGESGGECPLCDEIGHEAKERFVALAVEVEPELSGKRITGVNVKYREGRDSEGNTVDYPQIGLVMQASNNFFNTLVALSQKRDVDNLSWEITREGEKLTTKYIFYPIEHEPDLTEISDFIPELTSVLDDLGSAERYERELDGVSAADQKTFGSDNKKEKKTSRNNGASDDDMFSAIREELKSKSGARLESY